MKVFYLFFASYILAHVWVFLDLRRWLGGGWWQLPAIVWGVFMAGTWILRFGKPAQGTLAWIEDVSLVWLGFILITFTCFILVDALALACKLLGRFWPVLAGLLPAGRGVPLALVLGICMSLYAVYEAQDVRVTHYTIPTAKLPQGAKPVRVAQLTDIHIGRFIGPKMLHRVAKLIQQEQPDIITVTGDLVDTDVTERHEEAAILAGMRAPCGIFAVTGNHEAYRGLDMSLDFMKKTNMTVLRSQGVDACGIHIVGVDDLSVTLRHDGDWDPTPVLKAYEGGKFVLLLKHRPGTPEASIGLFDLQLSGHTHNGQIWPGSIFSKIVNGNEQGFEVLTEGSRKSERIVSNGTGFWGPPMRLFAPPEIVIVDIVPEGNEAPAAP